MDDALFMHVLEALADLFDDSCGFSLWHFPFLLDLLQTAVGEGLNDEVEIVLVVEVAEEGGQVGVIEVGLDLNLP